MYLGVPNACWRRITIASCDGLISLRIHHERGTALGCGVILNVLRPDIGGHIAKSLVTDTATFNTLMCNTKIFYAHPRFSWRHQDFLRRQTKIFAKKWKEVPYTTV